MATYRIYEFDGVTLPEYNPEQADNTGSVNSSIVNAGGRTFDVWNGYVRIPKTKNVVVSGIYAGDYPVYLVDDVADFLVDDTGNFLVELDNSTAATRDQVEQLRQKIGRQGSLYRYRWEDTSVTQFITARLLEVKQQEELEHRTVISKVEAVFETLDVGWKNSSASTASASVPSGSTGAMAVYNTGTLPVEDAVLTIAATGTITSVVVTGSGISFTWSGTLTNGQTLRISDANATVSIGSTNSYSGFSLGSGHTVDGWLYLPVGESTITVYCNGPATATLTWYNKFA